MMKNYVISLTTASERRDHIIREFGKQGVDFEFFDAITPEQVPSLAKTFHVNITNTPLTQGELACLFSHVCLWQKAIDDNLDYIAIFEDDVYLGENADTFLNSTDWIPNGLNIIKLEKFNNYRKMSLKKIKVAGNRSLRKLKDAHLGAAGYILSQQACIYLIEKIKKYQKIKALDHIVFEDCILTDFKNTYQLTPALCIQSDRLQKPPKIFLSSLEQNRRNRINQEIVKNKSKKYKVKRELYRLSKQAIFVIPAIITRLLNKINFI